MPITVSPDLAFHLRTRSTSYVLKVFPSGLVAHVYWGTRLDDPDLTPLVRLVQRDRPTWEGGGLADDFVGALDAMPQEYPTRGTGDFRPPAIEVTWADGSSVCDLRYSSQRIVSGTVPLPGLPGVSSEERDGTETLELTLADPQGLEVVVRYGVHPDHDALTRSVTVVNRSGQPVGLDRVLSVSVDLYGGDFDELHLSGSWGRERHPVRTPLRMGGHTVESTRGLSSHQHNPFVALLRPGTSEDQGDVFGFNLVYSGNFLIQTEADQHGWTRACLGIHPTGFRWVLDSGQSFQAPQTVLVRSSQGLGGLSRTFHRLYRERLVRGPWKDRVRPILINNWEATYFDFDADRIEAIAQAAAPLGIELFVLDDGWFGRRDRDNSSLGDWVPDRRKLPGGLEDLVSRVNRTGLQFGLWFEPEMVSPDSDLYRAHPDWCLHVPGRHRTEIRNQLVLDLTRPEVRQAVVDQMCAVLDSAPIAYVKWDMNRPLTEVGSASLPPARQGEVSHRYVLGVYEMMETLTSRYPQVLFEGCSSGGARFDPGILHYMPQIWTSDDTDAVERLKIQWGTSLVYPPSTMGAHVAACPSHQTGRTTSLEFRGHVALAGAFGYELDATRFTEEERALVRAQVDLVKACRHLVLHGDFYRLQSPFEGNLVSWMIVAPDRSEALLTWIRVRAEANPGPYRARCAGLDLAAVYEVSGPGGTERICGEVLVHGGLRVPPLWGDFASVLWKLVRVRD